MSYYRLHTSLYEDFHILLINAIVEEVTEYTFSDLDNNTKYYWRIKAVDNQTGKESSWSDTCWFITVPANIIIQQTSASNNITYQTGSNVIWPPTCLINDGNLGSGLCLSGTYEGQLGTGLCLGGCLMTEE